QRGFDQKSVTKLLKKLSSRVHLAQSPVPEHQDIVLLLTGDRIQVRPASFIQEARWTIAQSGTTAFGSVHNLLSEHSPVHSGLDPLEELEALMNTRTATEADFQTFFERHYKFLLGTDYARVISQPVLVREDEHNL